MLIRRPAAARYLEVNPLKEPVIYTYMQKLYKLYMYISSYESDISMYIYIYVCVCYILNYLLC
jgi:hypothetical protein